VRRRTARAPIAPCTGRKFVRASPALTRLRIPAARRGDDGAHVLPGEERSVQVVGAGVGAAGVGEG
jgi:hypothetical protein